jgi:hypothetical protein
MHMIKGSAARRPGRHLITAAALAAAAAIGGTLSTAEAGIVYSGLLNVPIPVTPLGLYLSIDTGQTSTSPIGYDVNFCGSTAMYFDPNLGGGVVASAGDNWILNLAPGDPIDATRFFSNPGAGNLNNLNFSNTADGIVGFRFTLDSENAVHFGWARWRKTAPGLPGVLIDYAWNDVAMTGIQAGATSDNAGACCKPDGTCGMLIQSDCANAGGSWTSVGTPCANASCATRCCLGDGTCQMLAPSACAAAGGVSTARATCSAACSQPGACCKNDGTCTAGLTASNCAAAGGVFRGEGSSCGSVACYVAETFDTTAAGALPAGWASTANGAGLPWTVVNTQAESGSNSVFANDAGGQASQFLNLPLRTAQGNVKLDLWRRFQTENGSDGWTVEASINGGAFANIGAAAWTLNGYTFPSIISNNTDIGGQPAFSGNALTWTASSATIPASIGNTVAIRFRMSSDSSVAMTGVWLDNIAVGNASLTSTAACCKADGTCQMLTSSACASAGGTFNGTVACGAAAACPAPGACCANNGTCTLVMGAICVAGGGVYRGDGVACGSVACGIATLEVEPNETRGTATAVNFANSGDFIRGNTTGTSTTPGDPASADTFLVKTPAMATGIYRNRLTIESTTPGHTGTIRGLYQDAPVAGPWGTWAGALGAATVFDVKAQTSSSGHMNEWYGFGKQEKVYYQVTGTSSTTADYVARWTSDLVAPMSLGTFAAGTITISTAGQGHSTDTALWVYDANFNPIDGFGNDGESTFGGAPASDNTFSWLRREYPAGTYYLALTVSGLANNKGMPADDNRVGAIPTGPILDFPNALLSSDPTMANNMAFAITDSNTTQAVSAAIATRAGAFDINWYVFTVAGTAPTGACCMPDGTCQSLVGTGCVTAGGIYRGANVPCSSASCGQPGACCRNDGTCANVVSQMCVAPGDVFAGAGVGCAAAACNAYRIVQNVPGTWTDIGATGAVLTNIAASGGTPGDDTTYTFSSSVTNALVTTPDLFVCSNGNISNVQNFVDYANTILPHGVPGLSICLLPLWDDLNNALAPSRILHEARVEGGVPVEIIQWDQTNHLGQTATGSFQVKIWGPGGPGGAVAQYIYRDMAWDWNGNSATVGVQWATDRAYQWFSGRTDAPGGPIANNAVLSVVPGAPSCYANCDNSTTPPVLNVADFTCFLQKYAAADPYANCDNSTTPPVLNVADFTCFLQKYAAGCP